MKNILLGGAVDHTSTTIAHVAEVAFLLANFPADAHAGQSLVVSHEWFVE